MERGGSVYMLTNKYHTVIYTGVTSDLLSRIREHRDGKYPLSFTSKYRVHKLLYYENFFSIEEAINREKEIKGWRRAKKVKLIESMNPKWEDLFEKVVKHW